MTTLFLGLEQGLMRVEVNGSARADWAIKHVSAFSVAIDPQEPEHVVCTTLGQGVFRSDDGGRSFKPAGDGVTFPSV
jgi:hypothetical protein